MALGLTLSPSRGFSTRRVLDLARRADESGFDSVWFAESDQADAIGLMHAAATCTESVSLASGVIPIQTRPPALVAMGCANLAQLAPGRIRLGVGHSSPNVVKKWCGRPFVRENAIDQIREFVEAVRACLSGERVDFQGEWYQVNGFRLRMPPPSDISFVVAALGDGMAEAAATMADGVLMSYVRPERLARLAPVLRGGSGSDFKLSVMIHVAVTSDPREAVDAYRRVLVSYSTVDAYAAVFGEAGFADRVEAVRKHWDAGARDLALSAVDDSMVEALSAIGPVDHVVERIKELLDAGADEVVAGVVEATGTAAAEETVSMLAEAF